jgi:hypothetical protein
METRFVTGTLFTIRAITDRGCWPSSGFGVVTAA